MAKLPMDLKTTKSLIENAPDIIEPITRGYLGFSSIGDECVRRLWLGFRFASGERRTPVRLNRIFNRGHLEEERVISELTQNGLEVFRRENGIAIPVTGAVGEKQEELIGSFGHAKGHPDGRVIGLPEAPNKEHGLEIKTMNNARWTAFSKHGVQKSDPKYYAQMQRLMPEMGTDRFLIIATNKDNEKREYERVRYDKEYSDALIEKEHMIIASDSPAGAKYPKTWHECKMCSKSEICHNNAAPAKTCRSCEYADRAINGVWICDLRDDERQITLAEQLLGCKFYKRAF